MVQDVYQAAQQYVQAGFSVLPLQVDGSKTPVGPWDPYRGRFATNDEQKLWFNSDSPLAVGVACGPISHNLEVLDVDEVDLVPAFEQIVEQTCPGLLDRIITIQTPRDGGRGRQYWYRLEYEPPGHDDLARGFRPGKDGEPTLKALIETRSTGNYVVAAGGPVTVHTEGTPYQRIRGPEFAQLGTISRQEHEKLLAIARLFNEVEIDRNREHCTLPREPYTGPPRPGDLFNRLADWNNLLTEKGWVEIQELGSGYWRRPGKATGHSAVLGYFVDDQCSALLSVFSSNAGPLSPRQNKSVRVLSKFDVYAHLYCYGDYSAAALAVAEAEPYKTELAKAQQQFDATPEAIPAGSKLIGGPASEVRPKPLEFLWEGRFALGQAHIIAGLAGGGKSLLQVDMAAHVSTGKQWPDGAPCPTGDVILMTAEDSLSRVVVARLKEAGADLARVHIYNGMVRHSEEQFQGFSLKQHLSVLMELLDNLLASKLVLVDPLSAFVGNIDSKSNAEVRGMLHPLQTCLDARNIALVAIEHLTKDSKLDFQARIMGSAGIGNAVRATWAVIPEQDRTLLLQGKTNIGPQQTGLAFRIVSNPVTRFPRIEWEPEPIAMTAREYFDQTREQTKTSKQHLVTAWLRQQLPGYKAAILEAGKQLGFAVRTIERTFAKLNGISERQGFPAQAYWQLPDDENSTSVPPISNKSGVAAAPPQNPTPPVGGTGATDVCTAEDRQERTDAADVCAVEDRQGKTAAAPVPPMRSEGNCGATEKSISVSPNQEQLGGTEDVPEDLSGWEVF